MNYRSIYRSLKGLDKTDAEILDTAVTFVNSYCGDDFFADVTLFIGLALDIDYVMIGKLMPPDYNKVASVAFVYRNKLIENQSYSLENTPCEGTLFNTVCYYPNSVAATFNKDPFLKDFAIEAYMGLGLNDAQLNRIGLIALMDETEIKKPALVEVFLTILAPRIEEELLHLLHSSSLSAEV